MLILSNSLHHTTLAQLHSQEGLFDGDTQGIIQKSATFFGAPIQEALTGDRAESLKPVFAAFNNRIKDLGALQSPDFVQVFIILGVFLFFFFFFVCFFFLFSVFALRELQLVLSTPTFTFTCIFI